MTIHLFNSLAFAYRSKTSQDIENELVPEIPPIRRVVRKTTSIFGFFREILRYGEDCLIVSPDSVQTYFQNKIMRLFQNYQF